MTDREAMATAKAVANVIELSGRLSRTEWEMVYVAARSFAQAHGLSLEQFDLQSVESDEQELGITALVRTAEEPGCGR